MKMDHREFLRHRFALIDQVLVKEWPEGLEVIPLVPSKLNDSESLMPLLVPLNSLDDDTLGACLAIIDRQANRPALFSLLLESDASTERMQNHLTAALLPRLGSAYFYFRFFDPRVMALLPGILSPVHMATLLGPSLACTFPLDGTWNRIERTGVSVQASLRLSEQQFIRLERLQLVNQALAANVPADYPDRIRMAEQIDAVISQAIKSGVSRHQDVLLYIQHAMTWHPEFYRHPRVIDVLASMSHDDDLPYSAATTELDDEQWQAISKDLMQEEGVP